MCMKDGLGLEVVLEKFEFISDGFCEQGFVHICNFTNTW